METGKCSRCTADLRAGDLTICDVCKNALASEIKASGVISITFLILSIIIALTGIAFFFIAGSRSGPDSFRVGSRGATATPRGMLILSGCMILTAIGMFVVAEVVKKTRQKKEAEYLKLTGEELKHDYKSILP